MPTQNVNLTETLDLFVKNQVKTGYFNNASEVHRAALAMMAKEEEERQAKLDRLRAEIQLGVDDLDAGRYTEINSEDELSDFMDDVLAEVIADDALDAEVAQ